MATKKLSENDVKKLITDLSSQGLTSEKIGLVLRDKYGIKSLKKDYGFKISSVTGSNDSELMNLRKKFEALRNHFEKNKHDQSAKRRLITTAARIKRLEKYFASS